MRTLRATQAFMPIRPTRTGIERKGMHEEITKLRAQVHRSDEVLNDLRTAGRFCHLLRIVRDKSATVNETFEELFAAQ
jgi:hypothetical protein